MTSEASRRYRLALETIRELNQKHNPPEGCSCSNLTCGGEIWCSIHGRPLRECKGE